MKLIKLCLVLTLLSLSSAAFANLPILPAGSTELRGANWDTLNRGIYYTLGSESAASGSKFHEYAVFTIGAHQTDKLSFVGDSTNSAYSNIDTTAISNLKFSLYKVTLGPAPTYSLLSEKYIAATAASTTIKSVPGILGPGQYAFVVDGTSTAAHGYFAGVFKLVSAVPEPQEWALLIAGMGLLAWRLRNIKRQQAFQSVTFA